MRDGRIEPSLTCKSRPRDLIVTCQDFLQIPRFVKFVPQLLLLCLSLSSLGAEHILQLT